MYLYQVVECPLHQLLGEGCLPGLALLQEHQVEPLLYLAGLGKHQGEEHQEEAGQEHLHRHQEQLQDLLLLPPALALTTMPITNTTSSTLISSSSSTRLLGQPGSKLSSSSNSSSLSHKSYFKINLDSVTHSASTHSKVCHRFLKTSPSSPDTRSNLFLWHDSNLACRGSH